MERIQDTNSKDIKRELFYMKYCTFFYISIPQVTLFILDSDTRLPLNPKIFQKLHSWQIYQIFKFLLP